MSATNNVTENKAADVDNSTLNNSNYGFGMQGWVCPRCGRVISPYQNFCPFCTGTPSFPQYPQWGDPMPQYYPQTGDPIWKISNQFYCESGGSISSQLNPNYTLKSQPTEIKIKTPESLNG